MCGWWVWSRVGGSGWRSDDLDAYRVKMPCGLGKASKVADVSDCNVFDYCVDVFVAVLLPIPRPIRSLYMVLLGPNPRDMSDRRILPPMLATRGKSE